jgi:hypothetical protein
MRSCTAVKNGRMVVTVGITQVFTSAARTSVRASSTLDDFALAFLSLLADGVSP